MPVWQSPLPDVPLLSGFSVSDPDVAVRDQPDIGPPLTRRRVTDNVRPIQCGVKVPSLAIKDAISTFYRSDCLGGTLTVTWAKLAEHTGGGTPSFLFVGPPQYTPAGKGVWIANMQFWRLP